jgi:hypothetical protein
MSDFMWGTYGKSGKEPLTFMPMESLTSAHLLNILITETWHLDLAHIRAISKILQDREIKLQDGMFSDHLDETLFSDEGN